jgi:hypothetical protein
MGVSKLHGVVIKTRCESGDGKATYAKESRERGINPLLLVFFGGFSRFER